MCVLLLEEYLFVSILIFLKQSEKEESQTGLLRSECPIMLRVYDGMERKIYGMPLTYRYYFNFC